MKRPLRVGVACWPTFGGSGVIATEVGRALARAGHRVSFFSSATPGRLDPARDGVAMHLVEARGYPLFEGSPYVLALASKIVEVARRDGLDLVHAHYAVPHATSAWLAAQVLGAGAPKIVTTLHGTDITLVGNDPSYLPITRFSILRSDAVTAPSEFLRRATHDNFALSPSEKTIEVIPNFVDATLFRPRERAAGAPPTLVHSSNFRPLKRVGDAVRVLHAVRRRVPARLVLLGDGPDRPHVEALARDLGVAGAVELLGERASVAEVLAAADLFLLPSESESFGLAALEAMACGVPVVASRVGGVPEVVRDGADGILCEVGDVAAMADAAARLLVDGEARRAMGRSARARAEAEFGAEAAVARYEALYHRVVG